MGFSQIAYAANLILRANLLLIAYVYCYMYGPSRTFESVFILKEGIIIYIYIYCVDRSLSLSLSLSHFTMHCQGSICGKLLMNDREFPKFLLQNLVYG